MPIDHYRMTIQAKPLASMGDKHQNETTDPVLLGIARPLGHLRKTRKVANAVVNIPKPEKSEDLFPQVSGIGIYDSDDEMSSKGSTVSRDTSRSKNSSRDSLPSVRMTKSQLFENRYKLAAARSQPDATKPADMYSKRVVYLPMFRINVETYIGETEDHKTVETTRESLKKMLDNSRSKMKSPDKIARKLRDYFKQQEMDNIRKQEIEKENEISRKEMLRVNIPKTPFLYDPASIRIPGVTLDGRIHGTNSKVEPLDLTSVTDDDGVSVISAKTSKTKLSDNETVKLQSGRGTPNSFTKPYIGLVYGHESEREPQSNYATYSDIRRMRQKGRLKVVQKRDSSAKTSRATNDTQDAKDWITIQSKPVLKYTTPQTVKPKLDPIIVPSHPCSECPMCKAAKYKSTEPTTVPPNSPTLKRPAFEEDCHEHHDLQPDLTVQAHSSNSTHVDEHVVHDIPTHENFTERVNTGRAPEVKVKKAVIHSDTLAVSKVTIRMSRYKDGHMKNAKLTKSISSSTGSINEL